MRQPSRIILDFETRSGVDLTKTGKMKYLTDPQAGIIFMGYQVGYDKPNVWYPGKDLPEFMKWELPKVPIYAFNVGFDFYVWEILGRKRGFPYTSIDRWIDIQALCARYGFPQNLKQASKVLTRGKIIKDPSGKALIKEITQPPFVYTHERYEQFRAYCVQDVVAASAVLDKLPSKNLKMSDPEVQKRYALRGQTVELGFADAKGHRGLSRFHGRGPLRARAETGLLVLAQNLLRLDRLQRDSLNSGKTTS